MWSRRPDQPIASRLAAASRAATNVPLRSDNKRLFRGLSRWRAHAREVGRDLAARMSVIVPGEVALEPRAQCRIEPLEGEAGRDVFGLAAARRDDARGEHGGERRYALERTIGVPELVCFVAQRQP